MASRKDECVAKIARLGNISAEEAERLLDGVDDLADAKRQAGSADPAMEAAFEVAGHFKEAAKQTRLDTVRNTAKRARVLARVADETNYTDGKAAAYVLRSELYWVPGAKSMNSLESQWHGTARQWIAAVGNELRQEGLWGTFKNGLVDRDLSRALYDMSQKGIRTDPSASTPAEKIANAVKPALELARERQNAAGAHIGNAEDFIMHTSWDSRQMRAAGGPGADESAAFAAWWQYVEPRTADKTFDHLRLERPNDWEAAKLKFARSFYNAVVSGIHLGGGRLDGLADDGAGYIPPQYEGTRNIAKGVSQQRVWFPRDADAWYDVMQKFGGTGTLALKLSNYLNSAARNTALMSKFGTNPRGNFNQVVAEIEKNFRYRNQLDQLEKFRNSVGHLNNTFDRLDGEANRPANQLWAALTRYALSAEAMAHLGGVQITHIAAAPMTVSSELRQHGVSMMEGTYRTLKATVTGRGSVDRQEALAEAGAYAIGYQLALQSVWQPHSGVPGVMSYLAGNFMHLTGLDHFLNQFQSQATMAGLITKMGKAMDDGAGGMDKLHAWQRDLLSRYGINNEEWAALRSAPALRIEGQRWVTPKAAQQASEDGIKAILLRKGIWDGQDVLPGTPQSEMLTRAIERERYELGDKVLMYLNDSAEHSTVTPGVRERAMAYQETRPGSLPWMIAHGLAQFKLWPLTAQNQIVMKEIANSINRSNGILGRAGSAAVGIFGLLVLSELAGQFRMAVNDVASGRPRRDPLDPKTLIAALGQGGGFGIYGDFLFGETNRMGAGLVSTMAGPIVADADRLVSMYQRWKQDIESPNLRTKAKAWSNLGAEVSHFAISHVPFSNLIYLKGALNFLLFYHLYETVSPGWWARTNQRLLKENGRAMTGYVPGAGVPYGVPGIYLGGPKPSGLFAP